MKYTVKSGSQFYTIGTADSLEKAMELYNAHLDYDPCDDAIICDENGNNTDDWFEFVDNIMDRCSSEDLIHISTKDAQTNLDGWTDDGAEIPAGLTAEALQWIWNYLIDENEKLYRECIHEDDEASYQETVREAASYGLSDEDKRITADHPDWLCFPNVYRSEKASAACFFDLENLLADIEHYLGYDKEHCDIIRKAMLAYCKK